MAHALLVDPDRGRIGLGVVLPDRLDDPAVARRALVGDDDPPDGVLARADAGEAETNSHEQRWRLATLLHQGPEIGHPPLADLLQELAHLAELLDQAVDLLEDRKSVV